MLRVFLRTNKNTQATLIVFWEVSPALWSIFTLGGLPFLDRAPYFPLSLPYPPFVPPSLLRTLPQYPSSDLLFLTLISTLQSPKPNNIWWLPSHHSKSFSSPITKAGELSRGDVVRLEGAIWECSAQSTSRCHMWGPFNAIERSSVERSLPRWLAVGNCGHPDLEFPVIPCLLE